MLVNVCFYAQGNYTINGIVNAEADKAPLPGVSIVVVKTNKGTETDFDGNFSIEVAEGDVLQFSYLGYTSETVIISNQKSLSINLSEAADSLDEVVVVGYGTQKKSHLTGAISKVKNESLDQIAVARVDDALIGQISGVNIQATNAEAGGEITASCISVALA